MHALTASVRRLRADVRPPALQGRHLALLADGSGDTGAALREAAQGLGARVADVPFAASSELPWEELEALGRMLGRFYDAIDCGTLAAPVVERLALESEVPVYAGLGLDDRPARALGDLLTLLDAVPAPAQPSPQLLFLGDAQTLRGRAFVSAAQALGCQLVFSLSVGPEAGHASAFAVDASDPRRWSLRAAGQPVDETLRQINHRQVIQAVLIGSIVRG